MKQQPDDPHAHQDHAGRISGTADTGVAFAVPLASPCSRTNGPPAGINAICADPAGRFEIPAPRNETPKGSESRVCRREFSTPHLTFMLRAERISRFLVTARGIRIATLGRFFHWTIGTAAMHPRERVKEYSTGSADTLGHWAWRSQQRPSPIRLPAFCGGESYYNWLSGQQSTVKRRPLGCVDLTTTTNFFNPFSHPLRRRDRALSTTIAGSGGTSLTLTRRRLSIVALGAVIAVVVAGPQFRSVASARMRQRRACSSGPVGGPGPTS